jgi:hypothetical protein
MSHRLKPTEPTQVQDGRLSSARVENNAANAELLPALPPKHPNDRKFMGGTCLNSARRLGRTNGPMKSTLAASALVLFLHHRGI